MASPAGHAARGLIYAGLAYSAIRFAVGAGGHESRNQKAHEAAQASPDTSHAASCSF